MPSASERAGVSAEVPARIGLLGNPSDGYGGRVLACTVAELRCRVTAEPAPAWDTGGGDGAMLLDATIAYLRRNRRALAAAPVRLRFETSIPRQVGLSGSSAVIIGALRVLGDGVGHRWDPVDLARTALAVEVEELGWTAGPQDRVIQAHGGLMDMDFAQPWDATRYERLDATALPQIFLAWDRRGGASSDVVHSDVRERWEAGDADVCAAMRRFAGLAAEGRAALDAGRGDAWPDLLDQAMSLRRRFWPISERDEAMVSAARAAGAGAAFAGSGGAIVGVLRDPLRRDELRAGLDDVGAGFLWPTVGQALA